MAVKLKLKKRKDDPTITMSISQLQSIITTGEPDGLLNFFTGIMEKEVKKYIHDKSWLEMIVNWVPEGGLPMTTMAKWFKLTSKVAELDDTKEGTIILSDFQVALIWGRLTDPKYKMVRVSPQYIGFIQDFQKASGRHFEEEEPDKEE